MVWKDCLETIPVLPPPTDYGYEMFEISDSTLCMRPQTMNESAPELINDLAYDCKNNTVMITARVSTMNIGVVGWCDGAG